MQTKRQSTFRHKACRRVTMTIPSTLASTILVPVAAPLASAQKLTVLTVSHFRNEHGYTIKYEL